MLTWVRCYVAYPLSLRHLEEMMLERAVSVDHSTVHRRTIKPVPVIEKAFRAPKRASQQKLAHETYMKVKKRMDIPLRAVDKAGYTVDFLFRAERGRIAARRFFENALARNGTPETVTMTKVPQTTPRCRRSMLGSRHLSRFANRNI
jgi:transposase-like protein